MLARPDTKVRGRFCVKRCGPSRRRVRTVSAVLKNFVRQPEKTFSTVSARNGHADCVVRCPLSAVKRTTFARTELFWFWPAAENPKDCRGGSNALLVQDPYRPEDLRHAPCRKLISARALILAARSATQFKLRCAIHIVPMCGGTISPAEFGKNVSARSLALSERVAMSAIRGRVAIA